MAFNARLSHFRLSRLFVQFALLFIAVYVGHAAAPSNDRFSSATTITGTNVTINGTNVGASKEGGEPEHAGNPGGSSVWWTWTAPANGELRLATDGSDFDTLLGIYTGPRVNSLTLVATNDDHGGFVTSRVRPLVTQGTQYFIAVDGYNDGSSNALGNVHLALLFLQAPVSRPANDNFTNRTVLTGFSVVTTATNVQATHEINEPAHADKFGDTSVWFTWTATAAGAVRVSTEGSSFDTLLGIYTGTNVAALTEIASSDDIDPIAGILTSAAIFDVQAGQVIQIAVDGYDGAAGQINLRIETILTRLSDCERLANGNFRFTLTGVAGRSYDVEASGDLNLWGPVTRVFNTNGSVVITDPVARNLRLRFYRASLLPSF